MEGGRQGGKEKRREGGTKEGRDGDKYPKFLDVAAPCYMLAVRYSALECHLFVLFLVCLRHYVTNIV